MNNTELSKKENSAGHIFEQWIMNAKIEKIAHTQGLDFVKATILSELETKVGHGISREKFMQYTQRFAQAKTLNRFMHVISDALLAGDGYKVFRA